MAENEKLTEPFKILLDMIEAGEEVEPNAVRVAAELALSLCELVASKTDQLDGFSARIDTITGNVEKLIRDRDDLLDLAKAQRKALNIDNVSNRTAARLMYERIVGDR
jgi:hypothetical protein